MRQAQQIFDYAANQYYLRSLRGVNVLRQGSLGGLANCGERSEIVDSQLRKNLTVHLNLGKAQALDETVVGDAVHAGGSIDALDPQTTELTLTRTAVAVGVSHGVQPLFLSLAVQARTLAAVALRGLQNCTTLLLGVY